MTEEEYEEELKTLRELMWVMEAEKVCRDCAKKRLKELEGDHED